MKIFVLLSYGLGQKGLDLQNERVGNANAGMLLLYAMPVLATFEAGEESADNC